VLFQELIEQHGIHFLIANGEGLALLVKHDQIGVHLCHFLGHQPELGRAFRVKLFLVAESDGSQRENHFARHVHRFDCLFVANRGRLDTKLTTAVYSNRLPLGDGHSPYTGYERRRLSSVRADADRIGLGSNTIIADIDIVTACGKINTRKMADRCIAASDRVIKECICTDGGVVCAGAVRPQRTDANAGVFISRSGAVKSFCTDGGVVSPATVTAECPRAISSVPASRRVGEKRKRSGGRVILAGRVAKKRLKTSGRIELASGVVRKGVIA